MRAVIIIANGVEDTEYAYPLYRLQEEGFQVDTATKGKVNTLGKWGLPIYATADADTICPEDYNLVVIPGGYESPDRVRQIPNVLAFLREFDRLGKVISSICHGPWVLVSAQIVRGRGITCFRGCKDDIVNAGANYVDSPVVTDRNIVTAQHFLNNAIWMRATLDAFYKIQLHE